MSNSELFVAEKEMGAFEFGFLQSSIKPILRSKLGIHIGGLNENDGFQIPNSPQFQGEEEHEEREEQEQEQEEEFADSQKFEISKTQELQVEQEQVDDEEENGDGFRTPTSLEHKIAGFRDCPPAPKKPKSTPKRKHADFSYCTVDSDDLESILRPILAGFQPNSCQKIKKICVS